VTSEKVRVLGITMAPMFERRSASMARVTPLQVVEKAADLPHRGTAGPARQQLRSAGREDDGAGEQERRPEHTRHNQADNAGGYQQPAGLLRQLLDARVGSWKADSSRVDLDIGAALSEKTCFIRRP
jgi:hypothetical protein